MKVSIGLLYSNVLVRTRTMNTKKFDVIPGQDDLDAIERDLRFYPSETENPGSLSKSQIDQFNNDGFLTALQIFSDTEIANQRKYFDELLERVIAAGGDSYSISTAHMSYGKVFDLISHPAIVARVSDILGPNVVGWGSHYFCKMPGDGKAVTWHQDASYWPLTPSKTVTVWLAIDDADTGNGCMRVIPGSHVHGHIPYRESDTDESNVLDQTVENAEQYGSEPVDIELTAGQLSIHSDLLLHGSEANTSSRRRCGLTLRYCTAAVRAHMDWNAKGVIVAGTDESAHWGNPARPGTDWPE